MRTASSLVSFLFQLPILRERLCRTFLSQHLEKRPAIGPLDRRQTLRDGVVELAREGFILQDQRPVGEFHKGLVTLLTGRWS